LQFGWEAGDGCHNQAKKSPGRGGGPGEKELYGE